MCTRIAATINIEVAQGLDRRLLIDAIEDFLSTDFHGSDNTSFICFNVEPSLKDPQDFSIKLVLDEHLFKPANKLVDKFIEDLRNHILNTLPEGSAEIAGTQLVLTGHLAPCL
jgi:hypothetical protein